MKYLYILLLFVSCTIDTPIAPTCPHIVEWSAERERAIVTVVSDLEHVEICYTSGGKERCMSVIKHYYDCISLSPPKETVITIKAEETCKYSL